MPKANQNETPAEQSARFQSDVQRMINDGELNPIEAEAVLDRLVRQAAVDEGKAKE